MDFLRLTDFEPRDGDSVDCALCPHPIVEAGVVGITDAGVVTAHNSCYIENEAKTAVLDA